MRIEYSFNIKPLTTFGIEANASIFIEIQSVDELEKCRMEGLLSNNLLIIGGGSNLLFCKNYDGTILKPSIKGITIIEETDSYAIIEAKSGEKWDDFVAFTVENSLYGVENLSYIPGNVGACPVQNIGAYGVEIQSTIEHVEAFEIKTGAIRYFTNDECRFEYRDSIFKNELKNQYIITSVQFKLSKTPKINIDYKDVNQYLKDEKTITLKKVRDAIIAIRQVKLPDPEVAGNAGSFFKNPVVSTAKANELRLQFPTIVLYELADGSFKVAAGWLIDKAGWKGFRRGDAGVHQTQALCLVNYGKATGQEIVELAKDIQKSVLNMIDIEIVPEVRII